jgi:DHA3 family macrolide efflux protein-like MFS transporter
MRKFLLICVAQMVSLAGTQLTGFGLGIWLFQRTGSATIYGFMALATLAPGLMASPLAGALVDRWSPRVALLVGHAGAGLCSLCLVLLVASDMLGVEATLCLVALASTFNALHFPGLSKATTLLVPKDLLGRANGAVQFGMALGQILAPAMGGMLIATYGIWSLLVIDLISYSFAFSTLLSVRIPVGSPRTEGKRRLLLDEALDGWRYIRERPGLIGLLAIMAVGNFNIGFVQVLVGPLVLGFADARVLGVVASVGGAGMLVGSGVLMVWGGPRRRALAIVGFTLLQCNLLFLGGARPSAPLVAAGAFGVLGAVPLISGCSQVIWQRKVPLDLQGRVFAIRFLLAQITVPVAYAVAGPLADRVFEPLMVQGGRLADSAGAVLGVGRGRGVALLLITLGLLSMITVVACALSPRLRRIEEELPDHGVAPPAPSPEPLTSLPSGG